MAVILHFSQTLIALGTDYVKVIDLYSLQQKCSPKNLVYSDILLTAIFAEVIKNECVIERHLRDIHPLLDYDVSESQSTFSVYQNRPLSTIWLQCKSLISILCSSVFAIARPLVSGKFSVAALLSASAATVRVSSET